MESHARSVVKALSWRVFGTFITAIVAWGVTGKAGIGLAIGLADTVVKLGVYYAHERAWTRIRFGRAAPTDYEI